MASSIPAWEVTPNEQISARVETLRKTFRSNRTKDMDFRIQQIRKLYWGIADNSALIEEALYKDMRKCKYESNLAEIDWVKNECIEMANNVKKWSKDEKIVGLPMQFLPMGPRLRYEPLGSVLLIGAYNFPFQLNITQTIGAMASGNCVLLKPSEMSPNCAMVLKKIYDEYLDPECYACVIGAIDETKHLLDIKFDKIVFTGGTGTGTIIAKKAAEHLTPTLLELGGMNPAFVTRNANIKTAARRLVWNKSLNAGQVCLSHNYVLIDRAVMSEFIAEINKQYRASFPKGAKASPDLSRIVNANHFNRIKKMVDGTSGKIVMGGSFDESELFIEPTAILVDSTKDTMMAEESFGPVWSIMPYDNLDQAIDIAHEVDPTPLTLFTFGNDEENAKVLHNVTSGGATCNDGFFHAMINATPLGGVGTSGMGHYHGYYSIRAFSHQRVIAKVPNWAEAVLRVRYMPYKLSELSRFRVMAGGSVNFDRNGNTVKGLGYWLAFLFRLGGKSSSGAALRWGIVLAAYAAFGLKRSSLGL